MPTATPGNNNTQAVLTVDIPENLKSGDLEDLCDAAFGAIKAGGGFGWLAPPPRQLMDRYWKGVLLIPERVLLVGRLDGIIAGSAQLIKPPRNNEAQAHACTLTTAFVAPWARGNGLARTLVKALEVEARRLGFHTINLDVRETQTTAIHLFEGLGYQRWGTHPHYAIVDGQSVAGYFYTKQLQEDPSPTIPQPQHDGTP